tara:strand:- start:366 stop:926 length:561 start_codon:yes stop_codon:yes gene_type:complete
VIRVINKSIRELSAATERHALRVCDPFANNSFTTRPKQGVHFTTNDLNKDMPTLFHMEANDFGEMCKEHNMKFELLLWDPPYNLSQLKRQYESIGVELEQWQTRNPFGRAKDALADCIPLGGHVISFGFGSRGFGDYRGFKKIAIYNLQPSGTEYRYNIQVVVEKKVGTKLEDFTTELRSAGIEEE